jgi:serine O-acetyltransferase
MMRADIVAVTDRDPATTRYIEPILYFKGFHALQTHRLAHYLWNKGRKDFALYLQSRASSVFAVDINPQTRIGRGVFIDHGTGVVIGATAVIDDDVSLLQGVTLGGTGKERGDRHPKIRRGVLIGAGAKVLGNIEVGECSRVASGSVVLKKVPPRTTVAGIPARVVGPAPCDQSPAHTMDQMFESQFAGENI